MSNILEVSNLHKKFGSKPVLSDLGFQARAGEVFGLLGPNGAGKTTTIRVIATMLTPDSGSVRVSGFDIQKDPDQVRARVGVLTAELGVYHRFTGRENLRYFGELYNIPARKLESRINDLARQLDMGDFIDQRAEGYSTGMKQKLSIARSVIHDPDLVIFDEPTSGLDVLAAQTVLRFMQGAKKRGKCVIFSTHHMNEAEKLCDRVAVIHRGKLMASGAIKELKKNSGTSDLESAFLALAKDKNLPAEPDAEPKALANKEPDLRRIRFFNLFGLILFLTGLANVVLSDKLAAGYGLMGIGLIVLVLTKRKIRQVHT